MIQAGPVMLDIAAHHLTEEDKQLIANPLCGGLILFSRNFQSAQQIYQLTAEIHAINPSVIIAVDQEGGRVQRFIEGFSRLPALKYFGDLYQKNKELSLKYASDIGELMALEVQSVGCDISFAPVLDLGNTLSKVIGNRAFATDPVDISVIAQSYIAGMKKGGMQATGKHFPGHGSVEADSHHAIPFDDREFNAIESLDLKPFEILQEHLGAMMPAHIVYSQVDSQPAGFSTIWIKDILRQKMGFNGVVFSDDLSMKGAEVAGDFEQRAKLALKAGCDMVLVCNDREATQQVLAALSDYIHPQVSSDRIAKLRMTSQPQGLSQLKTTARWVELSDSLNQFNALVNVE